MPISETSTQQESFQPENMARALPGSRFWQILTGTANPVTSRGLEAVVRADGTVRELPSELDWYDSCGNNIDGETILGVTVRELLHNSINGITDSLRIVVLTPEAMVEAKKRLAQNNQAVELTGLGMLVRNAVMQGVEVENLLKDVYYNDPFTGKKDAIKSSQVSKVKSVELGGQMLLIEADKLRTPLDLLHLCDQIDATDPKAGKEFALNLLAKLGITALNAKNWQEVLQNYQLPAEMSEQTSSALTEIKERILTNTEQILDTFLGLAQRVTNNESTQAEDLSKLDLINQHLANLDKTKYREATQEKIKRRLDSLVPRLARRWEGRTEEAKGKNISERLRQLFNRVKRLWQGKGDVQEEHSKPPRDLATDKKADLARLDHLINLGIDEAMQLHALLKDRLGEDDSKTWLLSTLVERSQIILIQKMPVTQAMREDYKSRIGHELADKATIIEYLDSLETHPDRISLEEGREKLEQAESLVLSEQQTAEYEQTKVKLKERTDEICENISKARLFYFFPEHPFADQFNWQQLMVITDSVKDPTVKAKLQAEYEAKRKIVLAQVNLSNLLLEMIGHPSLLFSGGLEGWNKSKGKIEALAETSTALQIYLKENNCVGRMILMSGMLLLSKVFSEAEILVGSTYNHAFLGARDSLDVQRRIEASGFRSSSFFEKQSANTVVSKIDKNSVVINWFSLKKGFLKDILQNYLVNLNSKLNLENQLALINLSSGRGGGPWFNLSGCFVSDSLIKKTLIFRYAEVENFDSDPFVYFNSYDNTEPIIKMIDSNKNSPLLPWLKKSLLVMQRNLDNLFLIKKIVNYFTSQRKIFNVVTLRRNLQSVIDKLDDLGVPLPPGWSGDPATWSQEDIWNPELFPMPYLDEKDELQWRMPQKTPQQVSNTP